MKPIPNNVDWSATAAWIALAISITGTILGPIITTILTNRYQLKLRKLDLKEKSISEKYHVIKTCISSIGSCLSNPSQDNISEFGRNFFPVYAYVDEQHWHILDEFYQAMNALDMSEAEAMSSKIIHLLSGLLKEIPL